MIRGLTVGPRKPMSMDAKAQKYEALGLGNLPVAALTIRQTGPPTSPSSQSLTIELQKGEQTVTLRFTDLRQLRLQTLVRVACAN